MKLHTNPLNPDTDGDGEPDGMEYLIGSNPLMVDSDGDGLPDGLEDRNHNGRVDPGETVPTKWDSDGDGLPEIGVAGAYDYSVLDGDGTLRELGVRLVPSPEAEADVSLAVTDLERHTLRWLQFAHPHLVALRDQALCGSDRKPRVRV